MKKCMICYSDQDLAEKDEIVLCKSCLRAIWTALLPKIQQNKQESAKSHQAN